MRTTHIREAQLTDIAHLMEVRLAVRENKLSRPELVTSADYVDYLTQRGTGWVAEVAGRLVGFAVIDLLVHNVWALFVHPDFDRRGIGRALHDTMLNWYFRQTAAPVWLSTAPGTRAETFYRKAGWRDDGLTRNGEVKFAMTSGQWRGRV